MLIRELWSAGESGEARPLPETCFHTKEPVPPLLRLNWWHSWRDHLPAGPPSVYEVE